MANIKRATIYDIAKVSGFSTATVSLVLNNRGGIAERTRQQIVKVAENLGYDQARLKGKRRTSEQCLRIVGLLLRLSEDQLSQSNPFYSVVVSGIEEACRTQNIQLLYTHVNVDLRNRPFEIPSMVSSRDVDGLILVGVYLEEPLLQAFQKIHMPVVLVDGYSHIQCFDSVVTNNFQGAYQAVSYLFENKHQHIAMIGASPGFYPSFDERRYGYYCAVSDHHFQSYCFYGCDVHVTGEGFFHTAQKLLQEHPETTAIFCANDSMAIETIRAVHEFGLRVPDRLSVIGFDDIDIASYITPALTTMAVDKTAMGRLAVRILQQHHQFTGFPPITYSLPVKLIERKSVTHCSSM